MAVVKQCVSMPAKQFRLPLVPQQLQAGRVDEGDIAFHVHPVDGFGGGFEQQACFLLAAQHPFLMPELTPILAGQQF